ncbi:MAG: sugar phosphate isomerase/epimerase family protein, partial [Planctomycetota bacterium]
MDHVQMTRRRLMANAARAAAGLALVSSCAPARRKQARVSGGFKIGVCDWTIRKTTDPASLVTAKRIGLDGVQVDFGRAEDELPLFDKDLQKRFIDARAEHQIEIASLAMGVLNKIPYKVDPRADRWVREGIDVAHAMGVKVILLAFFGNGELRNDKKGVDVVVNRLRRVAAKAENAGVVLGIESYLSAAEHIDIVKRIESPAVQVYYDVANSRNAGYDIFAEIRTLGPLICEFHAKDNDDLYGKGSIDF